MYICMSWIADSRHPVNLWTLVCFFFILSNWLTSQETFSSGLHFIHPEAGPHTHTHKHKHFTVKPHSFCQALLLQEVSSWRRALYKNFLAVYSAHYNLGYWVIYFTVCDPVAVTHFIWTVAGYITAKRDQVPAIYDKMPMLNFSSVFALFEAGLKSKINTMHKFARTNKYK